MSDNSVVLTGNLACDVELKFTSGTVGGKAVATFRVTHKVKADSTPSFIPVVAWSTLGENCAKYLKKGDRVTVNGRVHQQSWDSADGKKRSKVEIVAYDVALSLRFANESNHPHLLPQAPQPQPQPQPQYVQPQPQPQAGNVCQMCGCAVKGDYKFCFKCNKARKEGVTQVAHPQPVSAVQYGQPIPQPVDPRGYVDTIPVEAYEEPF